MSSSNKPLLSTYLVITSILSGSITLLFSIVYMGLSILALIFRFNCDAFPTHFATSPDYFMNILYRTYILNDECESSVTVAGITTDYSVMVFAAITLSASVMSTIAASVLLSVITAKTSVQYLHLLVFGYVGVVVSSLIVDITLASHFGMDYSYIANYLSNDMTLAISASYQLNTIRLAAIFLMCLSLKGFVGHFINLTLLLMMIIYMVQHMKKINKSEHSIHNHGSINAYETTTKRNVNCPHPCEICQPQARYGSQNNYAFINDNDTINSRNTGRETLKPEYSNLAFDRSNSWQPMPVNSRPFSYLEDVKRSTSPNDAPTWRREPWKEGPTVPAPDYSPQGPRRLKSALKS